MLSSTSGALVVVVWVAAASLLFLREAAVVHPKALVCCEALQEPTHRSSLWLQGTTREHENRWMDGRIRKSKYRYLQCDRRRKKLFCTLLKVAINRRGLHSARASLSLISNHFPLTLFRSVTAEGVSHPPTPPPPTHVSSPIPSSPKITQRELGLCATC